jgi:hypothetical protein
MAITNLQRFTGTGTGTNLSISCAISGTINFIGIAMNDGTAYPTINSKTFDGTTVTTVQRTRHGWFGVGDVNCSLFFLKQTHADETVTFDINFSESVTWEADIVVGFGSNGNPNVAYNDVDSGLNASASHSYTSSYDCIGMYAGQSFGVAVGSSFGTNMKWSNDIGIDGNSFGALGISGGTTPTVVEGGTIAYFGGPTTSLVSMLMVIEDTPINATPGAHAIEVTMPSPASITTPYPDIVEWYGPNQMEVVVPEPTIVVPIPRSLPLVGTIAEMPGRVTPATGITDPVLTEVASVPTFVAHATLDHTPYNPRYVVMRPVITDPPEPVANVDGDGWVYGEET